MAEQDPQVAVVETEFGVELRSSSRNQHGTGFDLYVTVVDEDYVEMLMFQVICHERPEDPQISLLLTINQLEGILQCLTGGAAIADQLKHRLARH